MHRIREITLAFLFVATILAQSAQAEYVPVSLGTLGGDESWALGINNNGAVVGCSTDAAGRRRAFLWTADGGMVDLGTLGGANAAAVAVNDFGEIVGWSETADGARHAFLRTTESEMVDLGTLPEDVSSEATAVADVVVGTSISAGGASRAFYWSVDTNQQPLTPLVPGADAQAFDVNRSNHVVGCSRNAAGLQRAALWELDGAVRELGTLGGATSCAYGINEAGVVVGEAADTSGRNRAFCWTQAIGMQPLPEPRGTTSARASSISGSYQAAGCVVGGMKRAVLWDITRDLTKRLGASITVLPLSKGTAESDATAINDSGWIAGYCSPAGGPKQAVIWRLEETRRAAVSMALTAGVFVPVSSATRKEFTNSWLRIALQPFERSRRTTPHFTAESAAFKLDGPTRARLYDITFGVEKGFKPGRIAQSYLAVRGGPYYGTLEEDATGRREKKWGLNLNAAYGVIFLRGIYAEARYDYFSRFAGIDFSGLSISVGFRLFDLPR